MAVTLTKNQTVSLFKKEQNENGLHKLKIGVGWDPAVAEKPVVKKGLFGGMFGSTAQEPEKLADVDNDLSVFVFKDGKFVQKVYFGGRFSPDRTIVLSEDNRSGKGEGDDETVTVDLLNVIADRLFFTVNVYDAKAKKQHFGMVKNSYIRVTNPKNEEELIRYNLTDDFNGKTSIIFAEAVKVDEEWTFKAIGEGTNDGNLDEIERRLKSKVTA